MYIARMTLGALQEWNGTDATLKSNTGPTDRIAMPLIGDVDNYLLTRISLLVLCKSAHGKELSMCSCLRWCIEPYLEVSKQLEFPDIIRASTPFK